MILYSNLETTGTSLQLTLKSPFSVISKGLYTKGSRLCHGSSLENAPIILLITIHSVDLSSFSFL